jgi:uncharacterized Zn-finger protein
MFNCNLCDKQFRTTQALNGHKRIHGPSKGKSPHSGMIVS